MAETDQLPEKPKKKKQVKHKGTHAKYVTSNGYQRRECVVHQIMCGKNYVEAAKHCGVAETTVRTWRNHDPVFESILAEETRKRNERLQVDKDWVLTEMIQLYKRCMQAVPVRDNWGRIIEGKWKFDATTARATLADIGKHVDVSAFENNQNINHNILGDLQWTMKVVHVNQEGEEIKGIPEYIPAEKDA